LPNGLAFFRLGLSVGKRAGNAVTRNGHKRRVREAFRHVQEELAELGGAEMDLVVVVRAHEPLSAAEYRRMLVELVGKVVGDWGKKIANGT